LFRRPEVTSKRPEEDARGWARALRDAAPYLGLGTSLAGSVLLGILGGYWLDRKLGTHPIFFLVGAVLGLAAAAIHFYRTVVVRKT
jgi:F0F1-type ATP synthase assembly protein I